MRLIDAEALKEELGDTRDGEPIFQPTQFIRMDIVEEAIDQAPTIKAFTLADIEEQYRKGLEKGLEERPNREIKKAHYIKGKTGEWYCSSCKRIDDKYSVARFCWYCGASMKEGEAE